MAGSDQPLDKAMDAVYTAELLLVMMGPGFSDDAGFVQPGGDLDSASLISKPDKFMGLWGDLMNRSLDRHPHDGYGVLKRWTDSFFDAKNDDGRRRKPAKRRAGEDEEDAKPCMPRCFVVNGGIDGLVLRSGFSADQVFEPQGNITMWQCGVPCQQDVWEVDKHFRFEIDPATHEAPAIKYVAGDANSTLPVKHVFDDAEEEPPAPEGHPEAAKATAAAALRSRLSRATPVEVTHETQWFDGVAACDRDAFDATQPVSDADPLIPVTFGAAEPGEEVVADPQQRSKKPSLDDNPDGTPAEVSEAPVVVTYAALPPISHRLQHVKALSRREMTYQEGVFSPGKSPVQAAAERKAYYSTIQPFFSFESAPNARARREAIFYNVSVFVADDHAPQPRSAGPGGAAAALPVNWAQGSAGQYFFSRLRAERTLQEPANKRGIDVVRVDFPEAAAPEPDHQRHPAAPPSRALPENGRVSVVVEVFVRCAASKPAPGVTRALLPYARSVFQLVGRLSTEAARPLGKVEPGYAIAQGDTQGQFPGKRGAGNHAKKQGDHAGRGLAGLPKEPPTVDPVREYVLATNEKFLHCFKIGVPADQPRRVKYFELEVAVELDPKLEPGATPPCESNPSICTVRRIPVAAPSAPALNTFTAKWQGGKQTAVRPAPNHQLCVHCHGVARPHVLMGPRDPQLVPVSKKPYQAWEKYAAEQLKTGGGAFLLLEVGCGKKLDPVRRQSETAWKKFKNAGKASFLRVSADEIEAKKDVAGDNFIAVVGDPKEILKKIDRMVMDKLRKKMS
ncbi:hypothetical protein DIPPA_25789 [Diplonema papillatum]|nr:hypothetical protein DIPPA_25789 [Diplonema papillatum]